MKHQYNFSRIFSVLSFLLIASLGWGQFTSGVTNTTPGTGNWTVPCGVTSITVQVWGGGGGGGGAKKSNGYGAGGGSGAYTTVSVSVTPGEIYSYTIGAGGDGGASGNNDGDDGEGSTFSGAGINLIAGGGYGGFGPDGVFGVNTGTLGQGGIASSTLGATNTDGVDGFDAVAGTSGAGGAAPSGGAGGTAVTGNSVGNSGIAPGGGGSGGAALSSSNAGGAGGNGGISVTWSVASPAGVGISYSGSPWCTTVGAQSVTLSGDAAYSGGMYSAPGGLTIDANTGEITPSTSTPGTYTVTYTPPGCVATYTTDIEILAGPTLTLTSAAGTDAQAVCEGTAIADITYDIGGTAASATVSGLPAGITFSFTDPTVTITETGTPAAGVYPYTVSTDATACGTAVANGSITISQAPSPSVAGSDETLAACATGTTLGATAPAVGTGEWSCVSGDCGTITFSPDEFDENAVIDGLVPGTSTVLEWTVSSAGCSDNTSQVTIDAIAGPGCINYCTPSATNGCSDNYGNINSVIANDINNPSSGVGAYEDFTGQSTTVIIGQTLNIEIDATAEVDGGGCNMWASSCLTVFIDWNGDGDFLDTDETTVLSGGFTGSGQTFTTSIVVPAIAVSGNLLMRIVLNETDCSDPCVPSGTGQVEDYTIIVAPCTTTVPNAGTNQTLSNCDNSTNLAGNVITQGTGFWVLISGSGDIDDPFSPTTLVTNLGPGTNTFEWQVTDEPCPAPAASQVDITNNNLPTVADAGIDLESCNGSFGMLANAAGGGETGVWSCTGGDCGDVTFGIGSNNENETITMTNFNGLSATLTWTITDDITGCSSSEDVVITVIAGVTASDAGPDQPVVCYTAFGPGGTSLSANDPVVGVGAWTVISNTTGGTLTDATDPNSTVTGISLTGTMVLEWEITSAGCAPSATQVTLTSVLCIPDEPCFAQPIDVNSGSCSFTTYDNVGMTYSTGMPELACDEPTGPDIWFSIVVPASGQVQVDFQDIDGIDPILGIYDGPCNALEGNGCIDDLSATDDGPLTYLGEPGSTIYVRVNAADLSVTEGDFGICAFEATTASVSEVLPGVTNTITCGESLNFYDPGGAGGTSQTGVDPPPSGNYTDNTGGMWTICPSDPNEYVQVQFNTFILESGFDKLIILSADTVIAQWTGTQGAGDIVTSINPGECLTFVLQTDYSWTAAGWEAVVTCTNTPVAAQITNACEVRNCNGGCGIWVCLDGVYNTAAGAGAGIDEVNEVTGGCWGAAGEVATSWFYFTIENSGSFGFEFVPSNNGHNINFALYGPSLDGEPPCPLTTGDAPIRCSFASAGGINTGLYGDSTATGIITNNGASVDLYDNLTGDGMAAPLDVVAGETYALVVDVYQNGQPPTETEIDFSGVDLDCTVLPIELIDFSGINQGETNLLSWITQSEYQNDYFIVERSRDGVNWEFVGKKDGAGTTSHPLFYSLVDNEPYFPVSYYRLEQTDVNGKNKYSKIVSISTIKGADEEFITNIFPNPALDYATFTYTGHDSKNALVVQVINSLGEIQEQVEYETVYKHMPATLNTSDLSTGVYQVIFMQGTVKQTRKLVIMR